MRGAGPADGLEVSPSSGNFSDGGWSLGQTC